MVIIGSIASVIPALSCGAALAARRSWGSAAPRGTACRCRGPPARAPRRIRRPRPPAAPRARCRRHDCRHAPRRCRPASDRCVTSSSRCASGGIAPTGMVVAESACSPSMQTPTSTDTIWPSRSTRLVRRNAVHDLLVDRGAERLGKVVQSLERRRGTGMRPDELLGLAVEILGAQSRPDDLAHQREGLDDDAARPAPWSRFRAPT